MVLQLHNILFGALHRQHINVIELGNMITNIRLLFFHWSSDSWAWAWKDGFICASFLFVVHIQKEPRL